MIGSVLFAASASATAQVTLDAYSWAPHTHPLTTALVSWCGDVEKATAARVKCNMLPKHAVAAGQTFDAVKDGLAGVSVIVQASHPAAFHLPRSRSAPSWATPRRILLTVALFFPLVTQLGYDPVWFGIMALFRGVWPFAVSLVVLLAVIVAFPEHALWMPRSMK